MSFLNTLRSRLWPSNRAYLKRSDELLSHIKNVETTLGTMKKDQEQLRNTVRTLDTQLKRLTSMQEYCATLVRSQSEKSILLAGWYGADNLGDELMLRTLIDYAPQGVRERLWVLIWQNANYDYEYLSELGIRTVRYPRSTEEASLLADSFDAIVWGGGAILDDKQYNDNPNNFNTGNLFIRLSEYMLARRKHVFAIGLSTNWRFESDGYIKRLAAIVQGADSFSVRDEISLEVLRDSGIDTSKVTVCPDVAFGNRTLNTLDHSCPKDFVLGFVPFYVKEMHDINALIIDSALEAIAQLPEACDARIELIPFYRSGDAAYLKRLRDACSRPDLVSIAPYTPDMARTPLLGCSAVICSRYHAALVAGVLGVPFLCVYPDMHVHYKNKCVYLSNIYQCPEAFVAASGVTVGDVRSFVRGSHRPTTQAHQFFEEASRAITELWRLASR
jgi:polysaccharide pyruvyl transferase WcaK-like protein